MSSGQPCQPGVTVGLYNNISAMRAEHRTIGGVPWQPWTNPFWRFDIGGPVHPSRQVTGVGEAIGLPALYSATKILADGAASLPLRVYSRTSGVTSRYEGPTVFDQPSVYEQKFSWIFSAMSSLLLHGNAWGLITGKDAYGFPRGIEWLPPEQVYVEENNQNEGFNPSRTKVFFRGRQMKWMPMDPDRELVQIKAFSQAGCIEGVSPIRKFAQTIMAGRQMEEYGLSWFNNGGFPPGIFKNQELEVDPDSAAKIKAMLTSALRGREPLVYGRDWDYTPVSVPPAEAQFIDAMQLNATQIAAIFNLPPDRVGGKRGDSLTYNTVEQSTLQIIEALHPWLIRFEEVFSSLLPNKRYVKFYSDALLRTDLQTRTNIWNTQRRMGLRTIDEIRNEEDLAPLAGKLGQETIPLDLMVALGTRAGAIPKSMNPEIDFLMDHAAKLLEKLAKEGIAQQNPVDPQTGQPAPSAQSPQAMLGSMIGAFSRSHPELAYDERVLALRELSDRMNAATDPEAKSGAWIPNAGREILP
jgi:HK97 family phage portal protein